MSNMSPIDQATVADCMDAVDEGVDVVNMRDCHSEYWGVDQLATRLESVDHKVEWVYHNMTGTPLEDAETGRITLNLVKDAGQHQGWDDGYMVTRLNNVNGIQMKHAVAGCNVKFGMTANPEDTSNYEHGFCFGLMDEKKIVRQEKAKRECAVGRYDMNENFTLRIKNAGVTVTRGDEENPFDVVGQCAEEGTSMYGMIHIRERDALGQLEAAYAIAMVTSVDINGNLLGDSGIDRLATSLEVPFTKVIHLDIGMNRVRDKGAARICTVLGKAHSQITTLVLSNNEIGDEGATSLAEALSKPGCKITKLWLEGNQIADDGAMKLAESLETESNRVTLIELAWNKIEDEGAQRVFQAIANEQCKVTHFTIANNKFIEKKTKKMWTMVLNKVPRLIDMSCGLTDDMPAHRFAEH